MSLEVMAKTALPSGWAHASLGELGTVYCGQSPSVGDVNTIGKGEIYVTGPEHWDGTTLHCSKWTTDPRRMVPDGCLFITVKGAGVGTTFPGIACAIGRDIYAYRPDEHLDRSFALYSVRHRIAEVLTGARGTIPGLSREHIDGGGISLPPIAEQRRIVAKLDDLLGRSRRAKEALAEIPVLLERYQQSVLAAAFRGELTADWRAKQPDMGHVTELLEGIRVERRRRWEEGELVRLKAKGRTPTDEKWKEKYEAPNPPGVSSIVLPECWVWATLDEMVEGDRSSAYGVLVPGPHVDGGVRLLKSGQVRNGCLDLSEDYRISHELDQQFKKTRLRGGELLLNLVGASIGRSAIATAAVVGANVSRAIAVLPIAEGFGTWVQRCLEGPTAQTMIAGATGGSAQPVLNLGEVRNLAIPLPPEAERAEVLRRIDAAFARIEAVRAHVDAELARLDDLDRSILTRAFRGELVPQDPADEPASVLLERIRAERAAAPATKPARKPRKATQ